MNNSIKLLDYLPAIFRSADEPVTPDKRQFVDRFLRLFEEQLEKIESIVDSIPDLFHPWRIRQDFLEWLAFCVALQLKQEWREDEHKIRALIDNIVQIYSTRGRKEGLQTILNINFGENFEIAELEPHVFQITITFGYNNPDQYLTRLDSIIDILKAEKPAHTDYVLKLLIPAIQIGIRSTIGVDTYLGDRVTYNEGGINFSTEMRLI